MSINLLKYSVKQLPKGFTLVELLMVILLMGVMAMTTLAVVTDEDDQQRYDATKTYLQLIKKAIVGDPSRTLNGETEVSGFVADMGRLPVCLRELVQGVYCDVDTDDPSGITSDEQLPSWQQDADSGVWGGWRGPYLQGLPESSGLAFRDGWKNIGPTDVTANADINYGWLFGTGAANGSACNAADVSQPLPNGLVVQSCGSNREINTADSSYAIDYPTIIDGTGTTIAPPLVQPYDVAVELGKVWEFVPVKFQAESRDLTVVAESLRAKLNYPLDTLNGTLGYDWGDDELNTDDELNKAPFLSATFPAQTIKIPAINGNVAVSNVNGDKVTFPTGATYNGTTTVTVPSNGDVVFNEGTATATDDSQLSLINCPCVVSVPAASTMSAAELTFTTAGDINFPSNYVASPAITADFIKPYLTVPMSSSIDSPTQITLPNGAVLVFSAAVNTTYFPKIMLDSTNSDVTVSESIVLNNTVVTTGTTGDQFLVPTGTAEPVGTTLTVEKSSAVPIGLMGITIVCDSTGDLFDGDCDADTDLNALAHQLKVLPRRSLQPPSDFTWNLQ